MDDVPPLTGRYGRYVRRQVRRRRADRIHLAVYWWVYIVLLSIGLALILQTF